MIRGALADDYSRFTELVRELEPDEAPPTRARWVDELVHHTLISERGGRVDGYVTFIALSKAGHVRHLVVAPEARHSGVGRELMLATARTLHARGIDEWHLNVEVGNTAAIALYEQLGMTAEHRSTVLRVPVARIRELPRTPASALPVAPDEDDDIERTLGLLSGRVAMTRKRRERVLVQLRDATCAAVGFTAFDPTLPGAMPFRVARPELAGTLLAALPHTGPWVQVVVEDDATVRDALLGIGSHAKLELLHYQGATSAACATPAS